MPEKTIPEIEFMESNTSTQIAAADQKHLKSEKLTCTLNQSI